MIEKPLALAGIKCLIMRPADKNHPLVKGVRELGGIPIQVPLIDFRKASLSGQEIETVKHLHTYDWTIFTSQNGVHFFMETLAEWGIAFPEGMKVAAVGRKTESALNEFGVAVDFVPDKFTGDDLAVAMRERVSIDERILIVKGNLARDAVGQVLKMMGCHVDEVVIYETFFPDESKSQLVAALEIEDPDVLIFTSPSTVENFVHIVGERLERFIDGKVIAAIGPVTEKALKKYRMPIHVCPDIFTIDELLNDLALYFEEFRR